MMTFLIIILSCHLQKKWRQSDIILKLAFIINLLTYSKCLAKNTIYAYRVTKEVNKYLHLLNTKSILGWKSITYYVNLVKYLVVVFLKVFRLITA